MRINEISTLFWAVCAALILVGCKSGSPDSGTNKHSLANLSLYCVEWDASFFQAVTREAMLEKAPVKISDKETLQKMEEVLKGYDVKQTKSSGFDHRILLQLNYSNGDEVEIGMSPVGMVINGHAEPLDQQLKGLVWPHLSAKCKGNEGSMEE